MERIEELEQTLKTATAEWERVLNEQRDIIDNAISDYQLCKMNLRELISTLQEAEDMSGQAWQKKYEIEVEICCLQN